jgi:hypothetical protein
VGHEIDPEGLEASQIYFLDIKRRRLQDDLILVVVLKAIGVFPVTTVRGSARWLHISHLPGFRTEHPQKGSWMKGSCPDFDVIGLLQDAILPCPKILKGLDEFLEGKHIVLSTSIVQEFPFLPNESIIIGWLVLKKKILDSGCLMLDKDMNQTYIQYPVSSICPPVRRQVHFAP